MAPNDADLVDALRPYFESAHLDARKIFHEYAGIDIHPDAGAPGSHATYPDCLPPNAKRGLFGEALCGLIAEQYEFVGGHKWTVPVFLFRYHADAKQYLFTLVRDPNRQREIYGRHGNDFIAIGLAANGEVERILAGEAKWRKSLTPSAIETLFQGDWEKDANGTKVRSGKGIWFEINRDLSVPEGLRQIQEILKASGKDSHSATILSLDRILTAKNPAIVPRTDLIMISGNGAAKRKEGSAFLPTAAAPADYTAGRPLQVIELVLKEGQALIDALYSSLWKGDENGAK